MRKKCQKSTFFCHFSSRSLLKHFFDKILLDHNMTHLLKKKMQKISVVGVGRIFQSFLILHFRTVNVLSSFKFFRSVLRFRSTNLSLSENVQLDSHVDRNMIEILLVSRKKGIQNPLD